MDDLINEIMEQLNRAMEQAGADMASKIRGDISTPCPAYHGKGNHSPIGGPPYMETGTLRNSVEYNVTTTGESTIQLMVGAGPAIAEDGYDYSADIELGTGKMKGPRPYVLNNAEALADSVIENFMAAQ